MKRAAFIAGAAGVAGVTAAAAWPQPANAQPVALEDLIGRIPGITGVFARTLDEGPPLAALRADESFASASVIKLAIMVTAYRAFDAGTASPGDLVPLESRDMIGGSPTFAYAQPGRRYHMREFLRAMIQQSDNTASNALITAFGFTAINGTIRGAGLTGTRLGRHFADVVQAWHVSANVTTPRDMGTLLYAIEHGARESLVTVAQPVSCRAMIDLLLGQEDKSKIASGLPPGTPCANKTGEIDGVRNDAAIVDPYGDVPYVLVVLTRSLNDTYAGDRGIAAIARRLDTVIRT